MIKNSKVKFLLKDLEDQFESMPKDDFIKKSLMRAIKDLKQNAFCGIQIPKKLIPEKYVNNYNIKNLWKYDLPNGWRLMYTITQENQIELISVILEWFSHKDYEKRFRY